MDITAARRWWPPAAVVVLLGLAALAATHSAPQLEHVRPGVDIAPTGEPDTWRTLPPDRGGAGLPVKPAGDLPGWLSTAGLVLLAVLVAALVALLVWALVRDQLRRRERRPGRTPRVVPAPPPRTAERVVAAVDAGLRDLSDSDGDPRRAVIACWVRLEEAAAAAGTPRRPGDTPTDLVTRLLAEHHVSGAVLATLAGLYRRARYATHTVDAAMRDDARDALRRLRADLAAGVGRS